MKDWKKTLLTPDKTIKDAITIVDEGKAYICLIVDETNKLLGTITDGDVRRGILKGYTINDSLTLIMNQNPRTAHFQDSKEKIISLMEKNLLNQVPIINENGEVCGLERISDLKSPQGRDNIVVLMAGGLGSRLSPLTDTTPKPLIHVGNKPILETIVENFVSYGFRNIFLSVNYRAEMIKEHFGNGSKWGANIEYIVEQERLGTAGALSLLPHRPNSSFIVMNGDLLTKINFHHLLDFHQAQDSQVTMCVREYDFQVPFGVVNMQKNKITSIDEKPVQSFFVNAGIYVLRPDVLDMIPGNQYFDMPSLFNKVIQNQKTATAFPLREYWIDIGNKEDLSRAQFDFINYFQQRKKDT